MGWYIIFFTNGFLNVRLQTFHHSEKPDIIQFILLTRALISHPVKRDRYILFLMQQLNAKSR